MTRFVARNLRPKQLTWNKATQDRINRVVSVISKVKIVKMLGLSKDMRWVSVLANASGTLS
jgi:ATP-binding cassette subfamily C (CFTR/MRP) protein 1